MERALVIGGFGFIGARLSAALVARGTAVTIVTPRRDRHAAAAARMAAQGASIVEADLRDRDAMRLAVRGQTVVFNLAGQSGALRSIHEPAADLDVNCGGALSLLEALRLENRDAKLVVAGSRLAYGAPERLPVPEDAELRPLCPHGVHKAAIEQYTAIYARLHGVRATTLRITNPYGPGQPSDRSAYGVINFFIHRALAGQTLPIYGDGAQRRDYLYIDDLVAALVLAGADPRSDGRTYNVGSGDGTRMRDAAADIIGVVGGGRIELLPWPALVREIDTGDFVADVRRIDDELGWRPSVALAEGLRRTVAALAAPRVSRS